MNLSRIYNNKEKEKSMKEMKKKAIDRLEEDMKRSIQMAIEKRQVEIQKMRENEYLDVLAKLAEKQKQLNKVQKCYTLLI